MQSYKNILTIIIPAYNEEKSLAAFLPELLNFCRESGSKLIIVNDGSKDDTLNVLNDFALNGLLKILNHKVNKGYGGAIKSGILEAETKYIITIDADGQHQVKDIEKLLKEIVDKDADMIVGSRKGQKGNYYRKIGKFIIRTIAKILLPLHIHDINSGMKIYNTELAKKYIKLCPDSMSYSDIIALIFVSQRHLILETSITIKPRIVGKSTINTMTALETLREIINIVVLFNPMKIFFPIAMLSIIAGLAWGIPLVMLGRGISVGVLLAFVTGLIFFFLGLIAEQLSLLRKSNLKD